MHALILALIPAVSFHLEEATWHADEIVVATEGAAIDGQLEVVEVWSGTMRPGFELRLSELARYRDAAVRRVHGDDFTVSGDRIVLFLRQDKSPANISGGIDTSVLWIEDQRAFAVQLLDDDRENGIRPWPQAPADIRRRIGEVIELRRAAHRAREIKSPSERALAFEPLLTCDVWRARRFAMQGLMGCGKGAIPVLRRLLDQPEHRSLHADAVRVLGYTDSTDAAPHLRRILTEQLTFWGRRSRSLEPDWWNGEGVTRAELADLTHNYTVLLHAIDSLGDVGVSRDSELLMQVRDLWNYRSSLRDLGKGQLAKACTLALAKLEHR